MRTSVIIIAVLILGIAIFSLFYQNMGNRPEEVPLDQVVSLSQYDQINAQKPVSRYCIFLQICYNITAIGCWLSKMRVKSRAVLGNRKNRDLIFDRFYDKIINVVVK